MKRILFIILISAISLNVIAQAPSKKCPTCGLSVAKCQYKGKHTKMPQKSTIIKPQLELCKPSGTLNGHDYVDLGLSVKWATCNLGAKNPSDYGDYYAWGEIMPKNNYAFDNLKYCLDKFGDKFSKYVTDSKWGAIDGRYELEVSDDAAYKTWGAGWRIPTKAQQDELLKKCKWVWTSFGGHKGYKITGRNGKSIFLPAAGERQVNLSSIVSVCGNYWSRTLVEDGCLGAYGLYFFNSGDKGTAYHSRCDGFSIRPIIE